MYLFIRHLLFVAERISDEKMLALTTSPELLREFMKERGILASVAKVLVQTKNSLKRPYSDTISPESKLKQTKISSFFCSPPPAKKVCPPIEIPDRMSPIVVLKKIQIDRLESPITVGVIDAENSECESSCSSIITNLNKLNKVAKKISETTKKQKNGDEYSVERIQKINEINGKPHFFVKWKGYAEKNNTWEPLLHLRDCGLLENFLRQKTKFFNDDIVEITNELLKLKLPISDEDAYKSLATFDLLALQSDLILLALLKSNGKTNGKTYENISLRSVSDLHLLPFYARKVEQQSMLLEFQNHINSMDKSSKLTVENLVDFEGPPARFEYINDVIAGDGVNIPDDPPVGCDCDADCSTRTQCCGKNSGSSFAYNKQRRIRVPPGTPVFECNKRCKCGPECMNRVVQQGRQHSLCIFKTANGCGWGVRTLRTIYEGQFICEYVGEIIAYDEAERRGAKYDAAGRTYLFDLDMNSSDNPYTIDAAHKGNVSRLINHSCDPNCGVWAVWINCLDLDLPRICLFALRRIEAGEELNFDYINQLARATEESQSDVSIIDEDAEKAPSTDGTTTIIDSPKRHRYADEKSGIMECRCQSKKCRKFLF